MEEDLSHLSDFFEIRESLPRPHWDAIGQWVESNVAPSALQQTWERIAKYWLDELGQRLGRHYQVHESDEFLLLAYDDSLATRVLQSCEHARRVILQTLDGVAKEEGHGKHVVLLFDNPDRYYDYVCDFYPDEGEFGLSGGMFIDIGYGHFAICPSYDDDYSRTIAHELNHSLLRHLPLPLWLNEGVTQFMEDVVLGWSNFIVNHEIAQRHRSYWNAETIDAFWSGAAFYSADEGQELSYHLSQVLFRNLSSDYPKKVSGILKSANYKDAGEAAFLAGCGHLLADRVSQFLGEGPWAPRTDYDVPST